MKKLQHLKRNFEALNEEASLFVKGGVLKRKLGGGTLPPPNYNGFNLGEIIFPPSPPPPVVP